MAHVLTFVNRFEIEGRAFQSVPYLISEGEMTTYQMVTHELTRLGPVCVDNRRFTTNTPHAFGGKIDQMLDKAFDRIEQSIVSSIEQGQI